MIEMATIPGTYDVEDPAWKAFYSGGGSGPGYGYTGGTGSQFFPTFGGQAQGFQGLAGSGAWSPYMRRRRLQMAGGRNAFAAGQTRRDEGAGMTGAGSGPQAGGAGGWQGAGFGGLMNWAQNQPPPAPNPLNTLGGTSNPNWWGGELGGGLNIGASLIRDAGAGGAFGLNPPQGIMDAIRRQAVQDSGARERAARLGLQARGDVDPSTYGFQALMSQLGGQRDTAQAMSQADLAMRQQQLQFLQQLLGQYMGAGTSLEQSNIARQAQQGQRGGLGGFLGGLGGLIPGIGGLFNRGTNSNSPGSGSQMGQEGFRYPYYGG